jgi:Spy/CpxP family protein refolding chaperone
MNRHTFWMFALGLVVAVPSLAFAQDRQGRGGFDPARFREEMMNNVKEQLGAKDDEWQVLQPKIEKVMNAQRDVMMSRFSGFSFGRRSGGSDRDRGGDRGGSDASRSSSPVQQASRDLRTALEAKDTPADQIAAKLTALREARAKAKSELEAAQKDLQSVLTPRQEAVLVSMGTLD